MADQNTPDNFYRFPDAPDADPIDAVFYKLRRGYVYTPEFNEIRIPQDFKTDLLSAPRWLWSFTGLEQDGLYRAAAVVHDWLYFNAGTLPDGTKYTRADADDTLLEIMTRLEVSRFRRFIAWAAVRLFGGGHWGPDAPDSAKPKT